MKILKAFINPRKNFFMMFILLFLFLGVYPAGGEEENPEKEGEKKVIILPAGKVINKDYFAYGEIVEISGTVNGDVYAAGGQIIVDGKINGDLLAAGGAINISGTISQNARIAGGNIQISGVIGRNLTAGTGTLNMTEQAKIRGGVVAAAGSLNLSGPIGSHTVLAAGSIILTNSIFGNLNAAAGRLRVTPRGSVKGDLTYWSDHPPTIDQGAKIGGKIIAKKPSDFARRPAKEIGAVLAFLGFLGKVISFASTLVIGLFLIALFPKYHREAVESLKQNPWISLGVGFVLLFMIPITAFILFVTILGISLSFILMSAYLVFFYLARITLILWAGVFLFRRFGRFMSDLWAFFAGLLVYFLLTLIPIVGGVITFGVLLFGAGASFLTLRNLYLASRE